jgi:hypothetical protein
VIVAGIDEAGYGPVLGPLVVSAAAFDVPAVMADVCLWKALKGGVCNRVSARDRRIVIADSKKLHKRADGPGQLERSVLSVWASSHETPPTLRAALGAWSPHVVDDFNAYPWYRENDPALPFAADAGAIRIAGSTLRRAADAADIRFAGFWTEPLAEGHFNRLVGNTRNKAVVLLGLTLRLIQRIGEAFPDREIRFLVDKQGGRGFYRVPLMRAFEGATLTVVEEGAEISAYQLRRARAPWHISFSAKGEDQHLPIALASLTSKYLREMLMHCFNAFWTRHAPDVAPTAGYYTDGQRFIGEVQAVAARLGVPRDQMVRVR